MYKIITLQNSNVAYVAQVNYVFQEKDFKDVQWIALENTTPTKGKS